VVDFYHRYRRGYPVAVIDALADAFALTGDDIVVDLGCGTGQLALPIAPRVGVVAGVDPEPDMLARARRAAAERDISNVTWMLGADTDVPALGALLGQRRVGAVTIGQALHWMDYDQLFSALMPFLRPGGGVAVITNGTPLWLQDSAWSHALRRFLEQSSGRTLGNACGTDGASQRRYRNSLITAGFDVRDASIDYTDDLDLDHLVGGLYSAFPASQLPPPDQRPAFAEHVRLALQPHTPYTEYVCVAMLLGRNR
jgi:ubiquinone/menaquinone biosynthesis C-methylase UbiE